MSIRSIRTLLRYVCALVVVIALVCLVPPQVRAAGESASDQTNEPTYAQLVDPNGQFQSGVFSPVLPVSGVDGMSIDAIYMHLNGDSTETSASVSRTSLFFTDFAVTIDTGDNPAALAGKKMTLTLPRLQGAAASVFSLSTSQPPTPRLADADNVFADCSAMDGQNYTCVFRDNLRANQKMTTVITLPMLANADLTAGQNAGSSFVSWQANGTVLGAGGRQAGAVLSQIPLVHEQQRKANEFDGIIGSSAVKQGFPALSDYHADTTVALWSIYIGSNEFFDRQERPATIYEQAGKPSDALNADGSLKNPYDVTGADLDYRLRLYPSDGHFTPKVRWTTRDRWVNDEWTQMSGCVYLSVDAAGNNLESPGWHLFDTRSTSNPAGDLSQTCVPYQTGPGQPDYTVGVQQGGHGFQIWFNPESKNVSQILADKQADKATVVQAYYETMPLDPGQKYTRAISSTDAGADNGTAQLYNRFHLTHDDLGMEKNTGATYSTPLAYGTRYSWGVDPPSSPRSPATVTWTAMNALNPSVKPDPGVRTGTLTIRAVDSTKLGLNASTDHQGTDLSITDRDEGSNDAIGMSSDTASGADKKWNRAWFQLARVVTSTDGTETAVPLTPYADTADNHLVTDGKGLLTISDLAPGTYRLYPTVAPAGYAMRHSYYEFKVNSDGNIAESGWMGYSPGYAKIVFDRISATVRIRTPKNSIKTGTLTIRTVTGDDRFKKTVPIGKAGGLDLSTSPSDSALIHGYVTGDKAIVLSRGVAGGQQTACSTAAMTADCRATRSSASDGDTADDVTVIHGVPWKDDAVAHDSSYSTFAIVRPNDQKYASTSVMKRSAASEKEQSVGSFSDAAGSLVMYAVKRSDVVNSPNSFTASNPKLDWDDSWNNSWAQIHSLDFSLGKPALVHFDLPVVDGYMATQVDQNPNSRPTLETTRLAGLDHLGEAGTPSTAEEYCKKAFFVFKDGDQSTSKIVAEIAAKPGTGTYEGTCVVSGDLPATDSGKPYAITEQSAPDGYDTTTGFDLTLSKKTANQAQDQTQDTARVALTQYSKRQNDTGADKSLWLRTTVPSSSSTASYQVLPLERHTMTLVISLYDAASHTPLALRNSYAEDFGSVFSLSIPGQDGDHPFLGKGYSRSYQYVVGAGYAREKENRCDHDKIAGRYNEVACYFNLPWDDTSWKEDKTKSVPYELVNMTAVKGYTLNGAYADGILRGDQTGTRFANAMPALPERENGTTTTFSIDYAMVANAWRGATQSAEGNTSCPLFLNVYEQSLLTKLPSTGGHGPWILMLVLGLVLLLGLALAAVLVPARRRLAGAAGGYHGGRHAYSAARYARHRRH